MTWPVPAIPAKVSDLEYRVGWVEPHNRLTVESQDYRVFCLIEPDKATLSGWVAGHLKREAELEGEVTKAKETITKVNGLNAEP